MLDNSYLKIDEIDFRQLVDVWSLGITIYSIFYLKLPFYKATTFNLSKFIRN